MAQWGVLLSTHQLTGEMFCLWECKQSGASLVSPTLARAHWAFKAVSLVRPRLPFLSTPHSTLLSHHLHLTSPPHSPAKGREKKINGFSIYRLPGVTTIRESQFTSDGWLIRTLILKKDKKSLQNSLLHDLSSQQVNGQGEWGAGWRCEVRGRGMRDPDTNESMFLLSGGVSSLQHSHVPHLSSWYRTL